MKKRKAALYDPYLDTLGGGERHVLAMMKTLEEAGYDISIFWDENINTQIQNKLNIHFVQTPDFRENIFKRNASMFEKMQTLSEFDILLYVTDGSYFFSTARQTIVYAMVPQQNLYEMNFINTVKMHNVKFFCNSQFAQQALENWNISSEVIYPCLDTHFINMNPSEFKKESIILSVGRFFRHLHSKRQDVAIKMFQNLRKKNKELEKFTLVLAGNLKDEDKEYFAELQHLIGDDKKIQLIPNCSFEELLQLYKKSQFYWHLAGYEIDEIKHPEQVEHLGITPLEAMSAGCITLCYKAGGPKELIRNGETGFLFSSETELEKHMKAVLHDTAQQKNIQQKSREFIQKYFRYESLQQNVWKFLDITEDFVPPVQEIK